MFDFYFETRFRLQQRLESWPARFAIISAYATTGEVWSDLQNRSADERLRNVIIELTGFPPQRINGYSTKGDHEEPSWCVNLDLNKCLQLGRDFVQDAIYWIENGAMYVVSCRAVRDNTAAITHYVAPFLERLDDL